MKKLLWLIIIISLFYLSGDASAKYLEKKVITTDNFTVAPPPDPLFIFSLAPFSFTTKDDDARYVKITIALAYKKNEELKSELAVKEPQIRHIINILLMMKKIEDLGAIEKKILLGESIKERINKLLKKGKITEVYFKEFIMN